MKSRAPWACACLAAILLAAACNPAQKETPSPSNVVTDSVIPAPVKPVIYQMLVRLFSNTNTTRKNWGTLEENGVGKFSGINDAALNSLKELGITHVWYTGVLEHATATAFPGIAADDADVVKGRAGSPYAIKDYYDVSPALADDPQQRMAEFEALLKRTHAHGLKAIIDFVPNHVARSYMSDAKPAGVQDLGEGDDVTQAFAPNNNFYYLPGKTLIVPKYDPIGPEKAPGEDGKFTENPAKATGNNVFKENPSVDDWFETAKLNYGVDMQVPDNPKHFEPIPSTWTKMSDILLFWAGKGVDGFRCDVAEMVPVEFWAYAIPRVKEKYPQITFIAEIYTPSMYKAYVTQGAFDYLYDKVGVYDKVRPLMEGKPDAKAEGITEALSQSDSIDGHMLRFLENHDEQRIASKSFAADARAAIPGMTVTALLGTGPVMIYFGQESGEKGEGAEGFGGEDGRTTIFDYWGVPAHQAWVNGGKYDGGGLDAGQKELRDFYQRLMTLAQNPAFTQGERILLPTQEPYTYAFIRYVTADAELDPMLVVVNFGPAETNVALEFHDWGKIGRSDYANIVPAEKLGNPTPRTSSSIFEVAAPQAGGLSVRVPALGARVLAFTRKGK